MKQYVKQEDGNVLLENTLQILLVCERKDGFVLETKRMSL